jgi:molybdate transport system regulatory protein
MAEISLRIDLGGELRFGPGKARLIELIRDTGSISAAGRALGMSYRRAWLLTDELNQMFGQQIVEPQHGGAKGGGARVNPQGIAILEAYRRIEAAAEAALEKEGKMFRASKGRKKANAN